MTHVVSLGEHWLQSSFNQYILERRIVQRTPSENRLDTELELGNDFGTEERHSRGESFVGTPDTVVVCRPSQLRQAAVVLSCFPAETQPALFVMEPPPWTEAEYMAMHEFYPSAPFRASGPRLRYTL